MSRHWGGMRDLDPLEADRFAAHQPQQLSRQAALNLIEGAEPAGPVRQVVIPNVQTV